MDASREPRTERGELDILTALRFVAAVGVVFHHVGMDAASVPAWARDTLLAIREHGRLGVQFFFTLSGFILAYVYTARDSFEWKPFVVARVARVFPVYLFALVLGTPMLMANFAEHAASYGGTSGLVVCAIKAVAVLLLLQAWLPSAALHWNGVSWSLSAEAFFYACFPRILRWIRARSNATLAAVLAGLLAFEVGRTVCSWLMPTNLWGFTPALRIHEFASGIVVCVLHLRGVSPGRIAGAGAVLILVPCLLLGGGSLGWEVLRTVGTHVGFCLLIPALAISRPARSKPGVLVAPLVFLGQISYAVYLLHFPLLTLWEKVLPPPMFHPVLFLGALLLLSAATFVWIEEPARRWIRAKASR